MAWNYESYMERAESMLRDGLTSEAARKDAMDYANRAHECAMKEVQNKLLAPGVDRDAAGWRDLYYSTPACHVWKEKHAVKFAAYPEQVAKANKAAELRAALKAAALVAKKPSPARIAKEKERDAHARTCQICARAIFADTGVIAHHGYQRPGDGWQTDSCEGARELPFEADSAVLADHITRHTARLESMRESRVEVAAECKPVSFTYETTRKGTDGKTVYYRGRTQYDSHFAIVTRDTMAKARADHPQFFTLGNFYGIQESEQFGELLKRDLAARDSQIESLADYLKWQRGRLAGWKRVEVWSEAESKWGPCA